MEAIINFIKEALAGKKMSATWIVTLGIAIGGLVWAGSYAYQEYDTAMKDIKKLKAVSHSAEPKYDDEWIRTLSIDTTAKLAELLAEVENQQTNLQSQVFNLKTSIDTLDANLKSKISSGDTNLETKLDREVKNLETNLKNEVENLNTVISNQLKTLEKEVEKQDKAINSQENPLAI